MTKEIQYKPHCWTHVVEYACQFNDDDKLRVYFNQSMDSLSIAVSEKGQGLCEVVLSANHGLSVARCIAQRLGYKLVARGDS